jgi:hypothetical protein
MNIVPQETSLVIAGAWNPAILTPHWVMAHGMETHDANAQMVQALFAAGLNGVLEMPRFSMAGFQYSARTDALLMLPSATTEESFTLIENVSRRILENLSHTPMGGLGHNFEFRNDAPKNEWLDAFANSQLDLVDACPGMDVTRTTLATSFARGTSFVNVQRYAEGNTLVVKFNFHHPVHSASSALEVLSGQGHARLWANYQTASQIVDQLYPQEEGNDD